MYYRKQRLAIAALIGKAVIVLELDIMQYCIPSNLIDLI